MQSRLVILAALIVGLAIFGFSQSGGPDYDSGVSGERPLASIERDIQNRFSEIEHLRPEDLAKQLEQRKDIVLVDVREEAEYGVSRLPGAIRVEPGASPEALLTKLAGREAGRTVLFYCSVGERSSRLASRMKDHLLEAGAKDVQNLKGGIFRWHNQSRPLVDASGATDYVHPFNSQWGELVQRQSMARYQPDRRDATK